MLNAFQFIEPYSIIIILALSAMAILLLIWVIALQVSLHRTKAKIAEIFQGNSAKNLEGVILQHTQNLKTLDHDIQELFNISNQINNLALRGLYKVGMIRFNPFKDVGGDQSFAIALLNGKNNGLVISSLFTREGTRIYSKSVKAGSPEKYPFTEEEEQAIKIALGSESKKIT